MWIEDAEGDLINMDRLQSFQVIGHKILAFSTGNTEDFSTYKIFSADSLRETSLADARTAMEAIRYAIGRSDRIITQAWLQQYVYGYGDEGPDESQPDPAEVAYACAVAADIRDDPHYIDNLTDYDPFNPEGD